MWSNGANLPKRVTRGESCRGTGRSLIDDGGFLNELVTATCRIAVDPHGVLRGIIPKQPGWCGRRHEHMSMTVAEAAKPKA